MAKVDDLKRLRDELIFKRELIEKLQKEAKIKNEKDLYGDDDPTLLFHILVQKYNYLLDSLDFSSFTKKEIKKKSIVNAAVRRIGHLFLKTKQVFEKRENLLPGKSFEPVVIPDEPVIFVSNHGFRDDILGTILAAGRHAYVMFGSVPQFYNTIDGPLLQSNGVILVDRKVKENKKSSIEKAKMVLKNGCSLIVFPEGVWNKSPNQLTLPLWRGVYVLAKETGAKIVPIVHYIKDPTLTLQKKDNPFHTVIDNPIDVSNMSEEEALQMISDSFNTWCYLMMEKYGKATRNEMIDGYKDSKTAWEEQLKMRIKTADKYDIEIETSADFIPKTIVLPKDVFSAIANLDITSKNAKDVVAAQKLLKVEQENDFQHRF